MKEMTYRILDVMLSHGLNVKEADVIAILNALRDPTDEMAQAVFLETGDPCWLENAIKAWQAGIDAALAESIGRGDL